MCCRALEASAEENAARMKRKRCEAQSEMCSPADWIRQDDWPVGIRNVGNTCWFSAVIQVGMRRVIGCMKLMRNRERIKLQHSKLGDSIHVFVNQSWLLITISIMRFFILNHYKLYQGHFWPLWYRQIPTGGTQLPSCFSYNASKHILYLLLLFIPIYLGVTIIICNWIDKFI